MIRGNSDRRSLGVMRPQEFEVVGSDGRDITVSGVVVFLWCDVWFDVVRSRATCVSNGSKFPPGKVLEQVDGGLLHTVRLRFVTVGVGIWIPKVGWLNCGVAGTLGI